MNANKVVRESIIFAMRWCHENGCTQYVLVLSYGNAFSYIYLSKMLPLNIEIRKYQYKSTTKLVIYYKATTMNW